nr:helix-turn-helix transcriptional regulator [Endozoicomonas sp.]
MNEPDFAGRLKDAMELAGVGSASRLARLTGIDRSHLYRLVNGEIRNPHKNIPELAEALGVDARWLATGNGQPFDHQPDDRVIHYMDVPVQVIENNEPLPTVTMRVPDLFSPLELDGSGMDYFYITRQSDIFVSGTLLIVDSGDHRGTGLFLTYRQFNRTETHENDCRYYVCRRYDDGHGLHSDAVYSSSNADYSDQVIGKITHYFPWKLEYSTSENNKSL